ncbi:hypothetical protein A3SI_07209 [Nitritalea halalkaliphila LW7]|uniref:Uncharacterized protein n=1 Tax=Nitritalea halalkaliphila LW7 TaxID=1189621 RepID=I5C5I4_9BACT|nr:hypothetical protein A3SI_07209 [Nitritalea halalkaliphila LW7]
MTLLKLKGISKRYSSSKSYAVRDLDLDVEEGEIVA